MLNTVMRMPVINRLWNAHPILSFIAWRMGWASHLVGNGTIYLLFDPRDRRVRYVGQTKRHFSARLEEHVNDPQDSTRGWVEELRRVRLRPEMYIFAEVPFALLDPVELAVMNFGKHVLGWKLLNVKGLM